MELLTAFLPFTYFVYVLCVRRRPHEAALILFPNGSRFVSKGGCVIINDTSSQTRLLEEILKQKKTVTAYEGYLVNEVSCQQ